MKRLINVAFAFLAAAFPVVGSAAPGEWSAISANSVPLPVRNAFARVLKERGGDILSVTANGPACVKGQFYSGLVGWMKYEIPLQAVDHMNGVTEHILYVYNAKYYRDHPSGDWKAIKFNAHATDGSIFKVDYQIKQGKTVVKDVICGGW